VKIIPYSEDSLAESLQNPFTTPDIIRDKNHYLYLQGYLGDEGLKSATIVIEDEYVSKDFLEDYASYYALCFEKYPKICKRVHFFANTFTEEEFVQEIINGDNESPFWDGYLGFIVVKPIPVTVIGYTVLKAYSGTRNFWGVRKYKIHMFGNCLEIESLAFQEQDAVLAACATTAIWSMLNKAAADFHTTLKSPSEITKDADNKHLDGSRLFPNSGLNIIQICQAIINSGMVTEVKSPNFPFTNALYQADTCIPNRYLKKIINAYAPIGIPIILVIDVPNGDRYGLHAVAVSGHKMKPLTHIDPQAQISYLSDNIEKLYAHDDQWGPFARITFKNDQLVTTWTEVHPQKWPTILKHIIIPLYPKIRISHADISNLVLGFDGILTTFFDGKILADLVWDVRILFSENYKTIVRDSTLGDPRKIEILSSSLPKYLWIATCYINENPILDIMFDATNVRNGMICNGVVNYLPDDVTKPLVEFLEFNDPLLDLSDFLGSHRLARDYFEYFLKKLKGE